MIVDLGTGDGRAVLERASAEPGALVIGVDANAAAMADASRRADRRRPGSMVAEVLFLVEAVEALPSALEAAAHLVTITMPWGSLLRGVLGLDLVALRGVASVVAPGGSLEILLSVMPKDRVDGMATLERTAQGSIAAAWRSVGLELTAMQPATTDDLRAARSSWARRLGDRPVWRVDLRRPASTLAPDAKMGDTSALPM